MGEFYKEEMFQQRDAARQQAQGAQKLINTLLILGAVIVLGLFIWWKITHNPKTMIVDLNHASKTELTYLDGVGPKTADNIIAHRPFHSVEDLKKVPGIGEKTYEKIKPRAKVVE